jgi:hypothetical protein
LTDAARNINVRKRKRTNQVLQSIGSSTVFKELEMGRFQQCLKQEITDGLYTFLSIFISCLRLLGGITACRR